MNMIVTVIMITSLLAAILTVVSFWLPQMPPNAESLSPYDCGFDPLGSVRLPFSLRFFLVAILFLLFDLEIALLLPLPWGVQLVSPFYMFIWMAVVLLFTFYFTLGLVYEWVQGGLE